MKPTFLLRKSKHITLVLFGFIMIKGTAQESVELPIDELKAHITAYKKDVRGPYYRIKWYCNDGRINPAKEPCGDDVGGIQHASFKPEVEAYAKKYDIYWDNILSSKDADDFWDRECNHSQLKQYQLVKYLQSVDDGWIYRKGQFYRGALQSEDEQAWGIAFFNWLLAQDNLINGEYYLLKQSLKDIPHSGDSNLAQKMRSESKVLADANSNFMKTRIKIHGNPSKSDIATVKRYISKHDAKMSASTKKQFAQLVKTMEEYYSPVDFEELQSKLSAFKAGSKSRLLEAMASYSNDKPVSERARLLAEMLYEVRDNFMGYDSKDKLTALDSSNKLEQMLFQLAQEWETTNLSELLEKIEVLSKAAAGTGIIELWEYDAVKDRLAGYDKSDLTISELNDLLGISRGIVEWSSGMVKANYAEVVNMYNQFEPLSYGFIDDRVRSSMALPLGDCVGMLGSFIADQSSIVNEVTGVKTQSTIRGLNPGYAFGELVVVDGTIENTEFKKDKIYVFERPPGGLKPVAGIMTVSEGNLVSHVQLLARNLGIPNAALSAENLKDLSKYNGKKVFYAVSPKGNAILKLEANMTTAEKALFSIETRSDNKITVPVDRIQLDHTDILNMRDLSSDDSGKFCGPKAANLAQLKAIFPDHVVEGFVIPFGIFRKHLDNRMAGTSGSYWDFLKETYAKSEEMKKKNESSQVVEAYQFKRLSQLRSAIENMELNADFISQLRSNFEKAFGTEIGNLPVFLRSDTNMEDLKEFTGAGLNLTLFNIKAEEAIIDGIKKVWASPYTERSLKWRQKYLLNPEYVFPSILVIPGVNVDYSGVVITTGINAGGKDDLTVAFSRGVGGAVDGQAAETRMITSNYNQLLSPSREPSYLSLPSTGGTDKFYTDFDEPILSEKNMNTLREMVKEVRVKVPEYTDANYKGAYDMEMGFKNDKLWLFQIRPFVENKKAKTSDYLKSITPNIDLKKSIKLTSKI